MSAICSNCGAKLSCGCQKRSASDGRSVCANCIANYENNLKIIKQQTSTAFPNSPNTVKIFYNPPK